MKTTKTKPGTVRKSNRAEAVDHDNPFWTARDFRNAKRFDQLPQSLQRKLSAIKKAGRPKLAAPKKQISLRLDAGLVDHLRQISGYNRRVETMLIEAWKESRL